eukprot:10993081-Alexandrium_andersonii.AAC.1
MGEPATVSGRAWLDAQAGGALISQAAPLAGGVVTPPGSPTRPPSPPLAAGAVGAGAGGRPGSAADVIIPTK